MANAKRGLGRKSHLVAAMAFAGAASMIGQHAQAAKIGGNGVKKDVKTLTPGAGRDADAGDRASAKGEGKTGSAASKRNGRGKKAGVAMITGKKAGAVNTTDKPAAAAAKSRDWSHTGNMTGGQKALADAGEFARKAVASGKSLTNRPGHAASMSTRASWRTRSCYH